MLIQLKDFSRPLVELPIEHLVKVNDGWLSGRDGPSNRLIPIRATPPDAQSLEYRTRPWGN